MARPVTADDVIASLQHHLGENSKSAAKSLLKEVATMKADGPDTVVFELTGGNADFPYTVSDYHMPIMPKKDDGTVDWESGIRTGAYMLDKFEPGVSGHLQQEPELLQDRQGLVRPRRVPVDQGRRRRAPMRCSRAKSSTWTAAT